MEFEKRSQNYDFKKSPQNQINKKTDHLAAIRRCIMVKNTGFS
jgi:hypothetical protein